jgi:hypothetical protein
MICNKRIRSEEYTYYYFGLPDIYIFVSILHFY